MYKRFKFFFPLIFLIFTSSFGWGQRALSSALFSKEKETERIPITGYWLSEDYYNCINEFRSPRKANEITGCNLIVIPKSLKDTALLICDFHEENYFATIHLNNETFELIQSAYGDTAKKGLRIDLISNSKIRIANQNYIKINPETGEGVLHSSLESRYLVLEEILFYGKYKTKEGYIVEFKKNGVVTGLGKYKYFSPIIFYYNDEGLQVDQMYLEEKDEITDERFGFKFVNNTLLIFKLNCLEYDSENRTCGIVDFGDLLFKLIKIN